MKRLLAILILGWMGTLYALIGVAYSAEIILQWDRNNPAEQVTGYKVYDYARPFGNTTSNTITLNNISTARRYRFTVTAVNATAESGPSNAVEVLIPSPPTDNRMVIKGGLEIQ